MRPDLNLVASFPTRQTAAMTVAEGIEHFLRRKATRGASANTVAAYRNDLGHFARFVQQLGQGMLVATMSQWQVARFFDDQGALGMTLRTQARRLSVLRMFFRHAQQEGWIGHDPTQDEQIRFRARRVIAPELDQLHALIDGIGREHLFDLRDRAMIRLALDCGMRISEVASLDIPGCGSQTAIDIKRRIAHVLAKGGGIETLPFNDRTARMLEEWLQVRGDMARSRETALFVSLRGRRLCRQSLHVLLQRRAERSGLDGMHWHLLRHRRISHVIETCGDKMAQQFARHASLTTTSTYGNHANSVTAALLRERADLDAGRACA